MADPKLKIVGVLRRRHRQLLPGAMRLGIPNTNYRASAQTVFCCQTKFRRFFGATISETKNLNIIKFDQGKINVRNL